MTLAANAQAKAAELAESARQQANAVNEERIAKRIESLNTRTGYSATYIDTIEAITGYIRDRYTNRPVEAVTRKIDRFQIDDVVVRWTQDRYDPRSVGAGSICLEGICSKCGLPCHDRLETSLPLYDREDKRAKTEEAVATAMRRDFVCAPCYANMPRNCPTCLRAS